MHREAVKATRTEGGLRAALASLERHAPSAEAVLRAVRAAAGPRRRRAGLARAPLALWPRHWPKLVMGIAAAAAAAGLTIAFLSAGTPARPGRGQPGPAPAGRPFSAAAGTGTPKPRQEPGPCTAAGS